MTEHLDALTWSQVLADLGDSDVILSITPAAPGAYMDVRLTRTPPSHDTPLLGVLTLDT
jgi:hypothetical protein